MGISLVSVDANISHENLQKKILSESPATKTNNKENESSLILHSYGFFTHLRPVCPPDLSPGPLFFILTLRLAWKDFSWHSGTTGLSIDVLLLPSSCTNWAVALEQGLSGWILPTICGEPLHLVCNSCLPHTARVQEGVWAEIEISLLGANRKSRHTPTDTLGM